MNVPDLLHYFDCRDSAANPHMFPAYFIGALACFVPAELWELAIEAAQDTDRREAEKAAGVKAS